MDMITLHAKQDDFSTEHLQTGYLYYFNDFAITLPNHKVLLHSKISSLCHHLAPCHHHTCTQETSATFFFF